ncbi:MAG: dihydropteroate synthase [Actinomycetota bacterium]|nr:dihydropteroate synthase [Actinomycetota bacterium]
MRNDSVFEPEIREPVRRIGARTFSFDRQIAVMAIVNRTPDSFHDRGATFGLSAAVTGVRTAVDEGADWVDIGGVPFGIHAGPVSEEEELNRVVPLIAAARKVSDVVVSVDTYRPEVARQAIDAGADVINDTSGLYDARLADLVAATGVSLVITHSLASPPRTPVLRPSYNDVVGDVAEFLRQRVELAIGRGVLPRQIIIDPGHDLNKNTYHSLELTRRLNEITSIGLPTLVATSNKDFIGETLDVPQDDRVEATIATLVICILQGARIVRVHDVKAAVAAVRITEAVLGWRKPAVARHNII